MSFDQCVSVAEILKPLRSSPCRIGSGANLLVEEIDGTNDSQCHVVDRDFLRRDHGARERRIIRELYGSAVFGDPVFGMLE